MAVKTKAKEVSMEEVYNKVLLPPELRKAHQQNDKAVMQAYGFPIRDITEEMCRRTRENVLKYFRSAL